MKNEDADTFKTLHSIERRIREHPEPLKNINEYLPERKTVKRHAKASAATRLRSSQLGGSVPEFRKARYWIVSG